MLLRLVRTYLRPYAAPLAVVVALQFVGTMAALYLPSLNADIIDKGVVTGDTGYIVRHGGLMLAVSLVQIICSVIAVWFSARNAMGFGRDLRAAIFRRVGTFSAREVQHFGAPSLITRETNDVQQVQMLVLMAGTLLVVGADHDGRRHHHGRPRGHRAVLAGARRGAGARRVDRPDRAPDGAELPADAGAHRRGQPAAARADHRRTRGAGVRPRGARDRALPRRQRSS